VALRWPAYDCRPRATSDLHADGVCHHHYQMKRKIPIDRQSKAKRSALSALRRAKRAAEISGVSLSDWEGEFLGSVENRLESYGRAFRDPEKGGPGTALSIRQAVKLSEIGAKARGTKRFRKFRKSTKD